jgi:homogentisate 1,2-dioxygenase
VTTVEGSLLETLPELLARAGSRRVLIITGGSRRYVDRVRDAVGDLEAEVFDGARKHVPEAVLAEARKRLASFRPDTIIALGGGSTIGLAKALRLEHELPFTGRFVAVPTTYAGSEQTNMYGITSGGAKKTGRDPRVRPDDVIYDVELTLGMPRVLTAQSLLNALAHPFSTLGTESLEGERRAQALGAIDSVYEALETLSQAPDSRRARAEALRGAGLAAQALADGTPGLHHKLAHRLGGRFDMDHGGLHGVLLPHSVHRLRVEAPALIAEIEQRLRVPDLEGSLHDFLVRAGAPASLRALGLGFEDFVGFVASAPELPRDLVSAAFHGRRPSKETRLEDWGLPELVSVRGPRLEEARRVVVALHGRGATADGILARAVEIAAGDPTVAVVAPQAPNNVWYGPRHTAPRAQLGAELEAAVATAGRVLDTAVARSAPERVVLFGFSQGACLAIELFSRRAQRLGALVALSGAQIGSPGEAPLPAPGVAGTPVLLGASVDDPSVARDQVEAAARALAAAGCAVDLEMVAGDGHTLHARQRQRARPFLRGVAGPAAPGGGFGAAHESEALAGALPRDRNSPRLAPYGLYAEQVSGTAFVAPRAENRRTWIYRARPAGQQGRLAPYGHETFRADFAGEAPEANLSGFAPLPIPTGPADFVDGMATLGGAGSPRLRRGYAVHVYAANRDMDDRCFYDADGDLLLVPQLGALTLMTELGILEVAPGEIAILPRGLRFSVLLRGLAARGWVAEVFGRPFELPDRGPVGANGLSDARHFRAPAAWYENRLAPGYRVTAKLGGELHQGVQDYSPYDVVAWHGNHCPYVYDLAMFSPVGNTRIDHGDPSIYTVLSAPLDDAGAHALDLVIFPPRWDATEGTFRPPYFHRNVTTEINGVIRDTPSARSPFVPGITFLTPSMTPHGVLSGAVERVLGADADRADRPRRSPDSSLWFQFESALPFSLTPWAQRAPSRIADWPSVWGAYRTHFSAG